MDGAGTQRAEGRLVLRRGVALVRREAVARESAVEVGHVCVARGLGEDGRRGDGQGERVAVDDASLGDRTLRDAAGIDQDEGGRRGEPEQRAAEGQEPRVVDVESIDLLDFGHSHCPGDCLALQLEGHALAGLGVEHLAIVDAAQLVPVRKDDRRRHHRAGEGGHPRLVHAGDVQVTGVPELDLESQEISEPLALGAVLLAPAPDHAWPARGLPAVRRARALPGVPPGRDALG
jgi:hypothetical protein